MENNAPPIKRTVSVQATGEVTCLPDLIQFSITVLSAKETVEAARASVKRRVDYILQVLRNSDIKERSIKCSTEVKPVGHAGTKKGAGGGGGGGGGRVLGVAEDGCAGIQTDILVQNDSLPKCEAVRNLLIEKLDPSVHFTALTYRHTSENKEEKRQEAFKKATANAKSKAQSIAQLVGVQLGPALEVIEETQVCKQGIEEEAKVLEPALDPKTATVPSSHQSSSITEDL